jgi:hypothetical protein
MTVDVLIGPKPADEPTEIVFIGDVDSLVELSMCSCAAGDDQPY